MFYDNIYDRMHIRLLEYVKIAERRGWGKADKAVKPRPRRQMTETKVKDEDLFVSDRYAWRNLAVALYIESTHFGACCSV